MLVLCYQSCLNPLSHLPPDQPQALPLMAPHRQDHNEFCRRVRGKTQGCLTWEVGVLYMGLAERASKTVALGVALGVALEVGARWFHSVQCQWNLALCQGVCLYFLRSHRWVVPICLLGTGSARFPPAS